MPTFTTRFSRFPLPFGLPSALGGVIDVFRPIIPVTLFNPGQPAVSRPADVLLDSGADFCIFPDGLARVLGIPLSGIPAVTLSTAGGALAVQFGPLGLQIGNAGHYYRWELLAGFVALSTPVLRQGSWLGVLGQLGGLDQFRLTLDWCAGFPTVALTNCRASLPIP